MLTDKIKVDLQNIDSTLLRGVVKNVPRMATLIRELVSFAVDPARNLYWWDDGVYKSHGDIVVGEMYIRVLQAIDSTEEWVACRTEQLVKYITYNCPPILDRPELNKLCLKNGTFDWYEMKFTPSDPSYRTTVQIPIIYDPSATCPMWDEFLREVCPQGVELMQEIIGLCMIPFTGLQKCIVLVGGGSNGKSTYLDGLIAAVGKQNVCNVPLQKLSGTLERFNTASLVGKLVNVFSDLSTKAIEDTANFKSLTGEDTIEVEYKNKQPFSYRPFCRLVFSTNNVVRSHDDTSDGYKRRFIHIPFMKVFGVNPRRGQDLKEGLASPQELSGLLNVIIPKLPQIVEGGFTITPEVATLIDNYSPCPPSTAAWLRDNIIEEERGVLPANAFYTYYCENCPHVEPFERAKLIMYLKNLFNIREIGAARIFKGVPPIHAYKGIKLRHPAAQQLVLELGVKLIQLENSTTKGVITLN